MPLPGRAKPSRHSGTVRLLKSQIHASPQQRRITNGAIEPFHSRPRRAMAVSPTRAGTTISRAADRRTHGLRTRRRLQHQYTYYRHDTPRTIRQLTDSLGKYANRPTTEATTPQTPVPPLSGCPQISHTYKSAESAEQSNWESYAFRQTVNHLSTALPRDLSLVAPEQTHAVINCHNEGFYSRSEHRCDNFQLSP